MTVAPQCLPPAAPAPRGATAMPRLAYLVNQYPQPSHSFIRREIRALEALGYNVQRFTVRHGATPLVDPEDQAEQQRTRSLLAAGVGAFLLAVVMQLLMQPRRTWSVVKFALAAGWRSDRGVVRHGVYFGEACLLRKWLDAGRIDHLHAHFGTNAAMVALLCRRLGGPPYSFTVHGPEEFDKPEFLHLGAKIEHAAFVVAISEFGRSQLYRWCSWEHWPKIVVVRCGVDAAFLNRPPAEPVAAPRLVCVARLHEQKGLPILLDAAARLAAEGRTFELQLIGDGPLRAALEAQVAERRLENFVTFAGWRSGAQVREALVASRALVLPSFAEGLPVVMMEALALGRPVVGTYVAGIVELIEPGVSGWLTPPGSPGALAATLREVLTTPLDRLSILGRAGARRVADRHDAAREAARLAQYFADSRVGVE